MMLLPKHTDMPSFSGFQEHEGYLSGQLLVATPQLTGDEFHRSVIYIFAHDEAGAMGVVINRPLPGIHFSSLFEQLDISLDQLQMDIPIYVGGPVDRSRGFVLYNGDYACDEAVSIANGIGVTANAGILRDIARDSGPEKCLICVGYAGWEAGQLESEIAQNSWITVPATQSLLFDIPDETKWGMASGQLGIDMGFYSSAVGHA